jgi:adenosylcobinamide amidohydrolase
VIAVGLTRPWLIAELRCPMRVLSWAPVGAGYTMADHVVWREVRNADLPIGFDVERWFADEMAAAYPGAIGMLTSRDIGTFAQGAACVDGVSAQCVATVGLTNGEAVGARRPWGAREFGTINIVVATDAALTKAAQLEALSIAVQARTAAVIATGVSFETGPVTGTGTDCLALACVPGRLRYAGLHTPVGEAIGAAVKAAVTTGAQSWMQWYQSASKGAGG